MKQRNQNYQQKVNFIIFVPFIVYNAPLRLNDCKCEDSNDGAFVV